MEFEMLASGYGLLEAPRVDDLGRLYFTDIPNGGVYRRNPGGNVETLIPKRKGVGGMIFNPAAASCSPAARLIHWDEKTGKSRDLFAAWEGKPISMNDLTTDDHGSVYTGTINFNPLSNDKPIPGSLFRIDPPGRAVKLWDGIEVSNGLGFSPDRKHLYHSDSSTRRGVGLRRHARARRQGSAHLCENARGNARRAGGRCARRRVGCGCPRRRGRAFLEGRHRRQANQIAGDDGDQPGLRRPRHARSLRRDRRQHRRSKSQGNDFPRRAPTCPACRCRKRTSSFSRFSSRQRPVHDRIFRRTARAIRPAMRRRRSSTRMRQLASRRPSIRPAIVRRTRSSRRAIGTMFDSAPDSGIAIIARAE